MKRVLIELYGEDEASMQADVTDEQFYFLLTLVRGLNGKHQPTYAPTFHVSTIESVSSNSDDEGGANEN